MKIFIGADHRGFFLKEKVEDFLRAEGYAFEDVSGEEYDPNDDFQFLLTEPWLKFKLLMIATRERFCCAVARKAWAWRLIALKVFALQ